MHILTFSSQIWAKEKCTLYTATYDNNGKIFALKEVSYHVIGSLVGHCFPNQSHSHMFVLLWPNLTLFIS